MLDGTATFLDANNLLSVTVFEAGHFGVGLGTCLRQSGDRVFSRGVGKARYFCLVLRRLPSHPLVEALPHREDIIQQLSVSVRNNVPVNLGLHFAAEILADCCKFFGDPLLLTDCVQPPSRRLRAPSSNV